MFKINFHLVIYRYEMVVALIVLLLTGSIVVSSKDRPQDLADQNPRYPYKIALTFDDGPHPDFTDRLVSALRRDNVKATFFIVGKQGMEYPMLIKELSMAGHEVEVHGFTHVNLTKISDDKIEKELSLTRAVIEDITGKKCLYFRPPGGNYDARVLKYAGAVGQGMVLWSVFPKDHDEGDSELIIQKVFAQASDGGVVLLHSGREPTLKALPVIIARLREMGFQFVTVEQLRTGGGPQNQLVWRK